MSDAVVVEEAAPRRLSRRERHHGSLRKTRAFFKRVGKAQAASARNPLRKTIAPRLFRLAADENHGWAASSGNVDRISRAALASVRNVLYSQMQRVCAEIADVQAKAQTRTVTADEVHAAAVRTGIQALQPQYVDTATAIVAVGKLLPQKPPKK